LYSEAERYIAQDRAVFTTQQQTFIAEEPCHTPTGEMRWFQTIKKPLFSKDGQVHQVLGVSTDITERKQAEEVQRQTQARLQRLVEANLIGVFFADFSGNITEANDAFLEMVGYTREELCAGKVRWLDMTPPGYAEDDAKAREQIRLTGACTPHEKEYIRKDGSRVPVLIGSALLEGSDQDCVCFALDLTWRKQAEQQIRESLQEKEVLLQEIHHRVKNNLQVISSLLDLQSLQLKEPTVLAMFQDSCNRVKSMALVHENLYQSKNFARVNFTEYIESLTSSLFQVYGVNNNSITLERELDEVNLSIDRAIPCGLIINELVSNAFKYAFPDQTEGRISIALHFGKDKYYTLTIKDKGIGLPLDLDIKAVESLGLQLVRILTEQLEGTLELNCRFGTEFRIRFPEVNHKKLRTIF
jgi:PAS domain S-box-containing protein